MPTVEIYALLEPNSQEIRYIGKARNSQSRLKTHIRDSRRRNTPVYCWMRKVLGRGEVPGLIVLATVSAIDWQAAEKSLILKHKSPRLLNLAEGGDEPFCSRQTRSANGRALSERLKANPKENRLRELKKRLIAGARQGYMGEATREKCRQLAISRPDLFRCFAQL